MPRRVWEMRWFGDSHAKKGVRGRSFSSAEPIGTEGISRHFVEAMKDAGVYGEVLALAESQVEDGQEEPSSS